jgi:hypothetical protein
LVIYPLNGRERLAITNSTRRLRQFEHRQRNSIRAWRPGKVRLAEHALAARNVSR